MARRVRRIAPLTQAGKVMTQPMNPTVDLPGAAELLHLNEHTVEAWARQGRIPAHRVGRRWLFVTAELVEWVKEQPGGDPQCRSTGAAASGGASSPAKASRRLRNLLAQPTEP